MHPQNAAVPRMRVQMESFLRVWSPQKSAGDAGDGAEQDFVYHPHFKLLIRS
jgi:hypothetical protein